MVNVPLHSKCFGEWQTFIKAWLFNRNSIHHAFHDGNDSINDDEGDSDDDDDNYEFFLDDDDDDGEDGNDDYDVQNIDDEYCFIEKTFHQS